jgi:hypothetical protein
MCGGEGGLNPFPQKCPVSDPFRTSRSKAPLLLQRGASEGSNHSLRRIEVAMPRRRPCGYFAGLCLRLHFIEFQGLSG